MWRASALRAFVTLHCGYFVKNLWHSIHLDDLWVEWRLRHNCFSSPALIFRGFKWENLLFIWIIFYEASRACLYLYRGGYKFESIHKQLRCSLFCHLFRLCIETIDALRLVVFYFILADSRNVTRGYGRTAGDAAGRG